MAPINAQFQTVVRALHDSYRMEKRIRTRLLKAHGYKGVLVGLAMMFFGTAKSLENVLGPDARLLIGGLAVVAGVTLLWGLRRPGGRLWGEAAGLLLIGFWDLAMVVSFALNVAASPVFAKWPWDLSRFADQQPSIYPIAIYGALAFMVLAVHIPAVLADIARHKAINGMRQESDGQ